MKMQLQQPMDIRAVCEPIQAEWRIYASIN